MHARRNFNYATMLMKAKRRSREELNELPEFKVLVLIDAINDVEQPLKGVSPEERLEGRRTVVAETVDTFFGYLRALYPDDPAHTETFRDAIRYAMKHEGKLCRFLYDPMVPIDNGFCERAIKSFATSSRNWLFSYSIPGAEAAVTLFTLLETAKANGAHHYYYLKYLLETLPRQKVTRNKSFLDACKPWSESYRAYEHKEKEEAMRFLADQKPPERPRTPIKKDKCA